MSNSERFKQALAPIPFTQPVSEHLFAKLIQDFLREQEIHEIPDVEPNGNSLTYHYAIEPGFSVYLQLYKDEKSEVFIRLEMVLAKLPVDQESEICAWLLKQNYLHYFCFWFGLTENSEIAISFRCFASGITREHFLLRINCLYGFGLDSYRELHKKFGLPPFIPEEKSQAGNS